MKNEEFTPASKHADLVEDVRRVIVCGQLFSPGSLVVVGVSGGPDSVALLNILMKLRLDLGINMIVAHFDHGLRPTSGKDRVWVERFSKRLGIPCVCKKALAKKIPQTSLEEWAREQRFKFFQEVVKRYHADAIALAHTADDVAETVLMRIFRGSGLSGLRGIQEIRMMGSVPLVRPFLTVEKSRVLAYLKNENITYCVDETNLKTDFFRNKIRLKLLPSLAREYSPQIKRLLVSLSQSVTTDYDYLACQAEVLWRQVADQTSSTMVSMSCAQLKKAHPALLRMVLRMAFNHVKGDLNRLTFEHVRSMELLVNQKSGQGGVMLPDAITVTKKEHRLIIRKKV